MKGLRNILIAIFTFKFFVFFVFFAFSQINTNDNEKTVLFINPSDANNQFWNQTVECMRIAADQFKIILDVKEAKNNQAIMLNIAKTLNKNKNYPDYIILTGHRSICDEFINELRKTEITFILLNEGMDNKEKGNLKIGENRCLGALLPDYYAAAAEMTYMLIDKANEIKNNNYKLLLFTDNMKNRSSEEICKSIEHISNLSSNIEFVEPVQNVENGKEALFRTRMLDKDVGIIITYSYTATQAIINNAEAEGYKPGIDFVIGSFGLTETNKYYLQRNKVAVLAGGNQKAGAAVIAHIYDDIKNKAKRTKHEYIYNLKIVTSTAQISKQNCFNNNFKKLSKAYNSDFSIEQFRAE